MDASGGCKKIMGKPTSMPSERTTQRDETGRKSADEETTPSEPNEA